MYNPYYKAELRTKRVVSRALAYAVTASIVCATILALFDNPAWGWVLAFGVAILAEILYSR